MPIRIFLLAAALASTLALGSHAHALSLGFGIGSATLDANGQSNVEKAFPGTETSSTSPGWSFSLTAHHGFSDYLFGEIGVSELSYLEKVQKNNYNSGSGPRAFKITTKESLSAIHAAIGATVFIHDQFALFAKIGPALHENTFTVKQVINQDNVNISNNSDSKTSNDYQLRLYGGVGAFYNINDTFSLKLEYEEFGVLGEGAEVDTFVLPDTADHPEAAGVYVKRFMIGLLYRLY